MTIHRSPFRRLSAALTFTVLIPAALPVYAQTSVPTSAPTANATTASTTSATTCDKSTGFTLYSAMGFDSDIARIYQDATGVHVNVVDDSTGITVTKITTEGSTPQWDAAWFDGDAAMQLLDNQGLLLHWESPNIANYNDLGLAVLPTSHAFYPTGVTAAAAIVYNTTKISSSKLPRDWTDLLKPDYKNLVVESNPEFSGPSFEHLITIAQIMGGIDQAQKFFQNLKDNGLKVYDTAEPTLNAIISGDRTFAIVQDAGAYGQIQKGAPLAIIYPRSGVGMLPSVIAVSRNSQHQACATAFINYVLSVDGQNAIAGGDPAEGDRYYVPVITGTQQKVKRTIEGINFTVLDVATYLKSADAYKTWFHDNIAS